MDGSLDEHGRAGRGTTSKIFDAFCLQDELHNRLTEENARCDKQYCNMQKKAKVGRWVGGRGANQLLVLQAFKSSSVLQVMWQGTSVRQ